MCQRCKARTGQHTVLEEILTLLSCTGPDASSLSLLLCLCFLCFFFFECLSSSLLFFLCFAFLLFRAFRLSVWLSLLLLALLRLYYDTKRQVCQQLRDSQCAAVSAVTSLALVPTQLTFVSVFFFSTSVPFLLVLHSFCLETRYH